MRRFYASMSQREYYCVYAPISGMCGWLSVAALLTISSAIKYRIVDNFGMSDTGISIILLSAASIFAVFIFFISKYNAFFIIPIIWGMIGIWLSSAELYSNLIIGVYALLWAMIFIVLLLYSPSKSKQRYIFKR